MLFLTIIYIILINYLYNIVVKFWGADKANIESTAATEESLHVFQPFFLATIVFCDYRQSLGHFQKSCQVLRSELLLLRGYHVRNHHVTITEHIAPLQHTQSHMK